MPKFRSKPVEIEAVQLTRELADDCLLNGKPLPSGVMFRGQVTPSTKQWFGNLVCNSRQGEVSAVFDDWIIEEPGAPGLCYPCKPDVFEQKYEPVDAPAEST